MHNHQNTALYVIACCTAHLFLRIMSKIIKPLWCHLQKCSSDKRRKDTCKMARADLGVWESDVFDVRTSRLHSTTLKWRLFGQKGASFTMVSGGIGGSVLQEVHSAWWREGHCVPLFHRGSHFWRFQASSMGACRRSGKLGRGGGGGFAAKQE